MKSHTPKYLFSEISGVNTIGADIVIDTREHSEYASAFANRFVEILDHFGYTWKRAKLPAGDILINRGRGLIIERKTVADLIGTAWGQRQDGNALESELKKLTDSEIFGGYAIPSCLCCENGRTISMKQEYVKKEVTKTKRGKPVTVTEYIEKRSFSYKNHTGRRRTSKIYPNSWIGITQKVQMYTHYYEFAGVDHLISWIISRLKKEIQYEKDSEKGLADIRELRMANKVNRLSKDEQQRYILEGFAGLGPKGAVKLLRWAGSLRNVFTKVTSPEQITALGITKPVAENIIITMDHKYKGKKK